MGGGTEVGLGKLMRQGEGGWTREVDKTETHLAPDQLPNTNKQAPEPLLDGQRGAAEGLSTELDDDNLQDRVEGRRVQPAHLFVPPSSSSGLAPSCSEAQRGCCFSQADGLSG